MSQPSSLTVLSPGFLSTIQDLGRFHCAHWGLSQSGAADPVALRLGNSLLGNPPGAPAIEMTLVGGSFVFNSDFAIALAGADFGPTIDDTPVPLWQTVHVRRGQVLRCGATRSAARCYLCVGGGISVRRVLASSSTHLSNSFGGFKGRALLAGDMLECTASTVRLDNDSFAVSESTLRSLYPVGALRVTLGPQADFFRPEARSLFSSSTYNVKEESNRIGLRLAGPPIDAGTVKSLTTEGVPVGAIQVPLDGEPIVLLVEHPTTGGYPKIATVISADIHRLGQCRPRDSVAFEFVGLEEAFTVLSKQERLLLPQQCLRPIP